jgi:hypothetical protein
VSSDNRIYNNTFDGVQNAIRAVTSFDNTFSNNIFGNVTDFHYITTLNASMDIDNQIFDMTNIRAFQVPILYQYEVQVQSLLITL